MEFVVVEWSGFVEFCYVGVVVVFLFDGDVLVCYGNVDVLIFLCFSLKLF